VREKQDIISIVANRETQADDEAILIDVDELRRRGGRRVQYRLEKRDGSWLIAAIGPGRDVPLNVPPGTPVTRE
jgi:hypothetical protein